MTTTYTSKRGSQYVIYPSFAYPRGFDWHAVDYDGAPDSGDNRQGWASLSVEDAIEDIEETEDFNENEISTKI